MLEQIKCSYFKVVSLTTYEVLTIKFGVVYVPMIHEVSMSLCRICSCCWDHIVITCSRHEECWALVEISCYILQKLRRVERKNAET